MPAPQLTRRDAGSAPRWVVLMLHGGREVGLDPVDGRNTSWHRSRWMLGQITGRANRAGVSVWLLRYQVRGWNAETATPPSPVPDARWALEEVRRAHGQVPVVLLGHSMGARTAAAVADDPSVTGVVAVAPWFPPGEPVTALSGKHLAAAHGRDDRITSAHATHEFVRRARPVAASAEFIDMGATGHYMFRRIPQWNSFAVGRALDFLDGNGR